MTWSAAQYVKFEEERTRPARDLLAQVPNLPAGTAFDLGCGPGNSTELIRARFPDNDLVGLDNDDGMLAAARQRLPDLRFEKVDLAGWAPPAKAALFFGNAVFQWLPKHIDVLERLLTALAPGGVLAIQMPDNLDEPSHALMQETAEERAFEQTFRDRIMARVPLPAPKTYVEKLAAKAARIEVWHTVYYHQLANANAVVEWVKGTGLRPYLDALPAERRTEYLAAYAEKIRKAYPAMADGRVLLRFPRLFVVATKGG
ncbi:trans-aconitate 2-methyltransferase [Sinorhizobium alkalisoli]|uniref:Trans-aconitate 2-methyltransferase n=1 Tax=Sinorhizobium alkalisoli TaxID=1752398 RepID=A0A1E3V8K4_9HYPH|nr:trans-aconitate 2-methyltransferase [Sinorhizobium alkalisoli]MCA1489667.1 trans-aconitate 2-methyltransferase [Ensifer sp. NBAIM29]MCG5479482.1 trans-aconitate 2-methyltransferase [Sinorhizobium alkalisoli]ODR89441.1 trans-aconitate 2-methyltransferase [Sinorhizobium alkalisoli]QFI65469.1 Trans-aconitate 2-methyltransferase [Sinorhizobium alkalisoli]